MIIVEVYVDDIIFGSDDEKMSKEFAKRMQKEFEMSLLRELNLFLDPNMLKTCSKGSSSKIANLYVHP